jgi:lipopolysaccharide transport system permease protein
MPEPIVTVYSPESSLANPARLARAMLRDLIASRELSWRLAVRDVSAQYRQAFLGFMWALILPLANTAIWIFLSMSGIVAVGDTELPYPAYVFFGTMLWAIFIDAVNAPLQGTLASRDMLSKINFPREAIIVSGIYQALFNAAIKTALLLAALPFFGIAAGWHLLLFPLGILSLILVGTAIGVLITPVGLLYSDVGKGMPLLMQFLMYLAPVVFAMPKDGAAATLFSLNPLTPVIVTARDWLAGATPQLLDYFMAVNAVAFVVLVAVWVIYRLAMPILIERMSA